MAAFRVNSAAALRLQDAPRAAATGAAKLGSAFLCSASSVAARGASRAQLEGPRARAAPALAAVSIEPKTGAGIVGSFMDFFKRLLPQPQPDAAEEEPDGSPQGKRRVAVVGGTGATGKLVVAQLLDAGHAVTVLASSRDRATEVLEGELGVSTDGTGKRRVDVVEGRLLDPEALAALVKGTDAIVCCVGSRRGPGPGNSPEDVDWKGVCQLIKAAVTEYEQAAPGGVADLEVSTLFDFTGSAEFQEPFDAAAAVKTPRPSEKYDESTRLQGWGRLDDVIMGGQSDSILRMGEGCAVFEGIVRVEGGGFCGTRSVFPGGVVDASGYDGVQLRVRGDGRRYKLNLRDSAERGEFQYQASFDTVRGQWTDVFVPFSRFRAVEKSRGVPNAAPINLSGLYGVGLVHSRFQYDGFPNPLFEAGEFRLEIASIALRREPRSQFVLLSSAAVERSARAQTPEEREKSIPIVALNPGGVLSWKLSAEDALRASGLKYTVVRPVGLTDKDLDKAFLLESAQGDAITGLISREETAAVCVAALESPFAANVTFEVRRDDNSQGLSMEAKHWESLFQRLRPDVPAAIVQYPAVPADIAAAFKG